MHGDGGIAMGALAADADPAGEGVAALAALLADQTFTAVGTFVDGDIAAAAGRRDGDRDTAGLVAAAERGLAAGGAAVGLPADRGEGPPADGARGRPGVVPRRGSVRCGPAGVGSGIVPTSAGCALDIGVIPPGQSSSTASDQHQPASSRAIATSAITGRFCRAVNTCQRRCNRWFPS